MDVKKANHLINEKSPYLLQHTYNPVDWYPWGKAAFEKARKENKPIFLSIGYSTCHWCHVMAHESFEDEEVAELMNKTFVSIKVDREERPDVDNVYMRVCQVMTGGGGGWPLTIIMTPDKKPFFAATYIPKKGKPGMPGMMELIPAVEKLWKGQRDGMESIGDKVVDAIKKSSVVLSKGKLREDVLKSAYRELIQSFDSVYGGFGMAPKFPVPQNLSFLLRYWKRTGDRKALEIVEKTLQAMRLGGIYDHVGFGFHRYSTDRQWHIPHFEKMLYDQAMISMAYMETYQATGKMKYGKTAEEIFTYVLRDMLSPEGGFYSAEDADSEGKEGTFYLWDAKEMLNVLGENDFEIASEVFNINDESRIVHMRKTLADIAAEHDIPISEIENKMEKIRQKLFVAREKRAHPGKDNKILTDWNGLMIASLAMGTRVFDNPAYAEAAKKSANFILKDMHESNGLLLHYHDGEISIPAYLNDYAFFIWGLIELYESTFDVKFLKKAIELNSELLEHFWDEQGGGFYFISDNSEEIFMRQKDAHDIAIPSGNSVAMINMLRLGRITADEELEERAFIMAETFSGDVMGFPSAYISFLSSLDFMIGPSYEVVVAGDSSSPETNKIMREINRVFVPNKVVVLRPTEQEMPEIVEIAEFVREMKEIDGKPAVYICSNYTCRNPITDINAIRHAFDGSE